MNKKQLIVTCGFVLMFLAGCEQRWEGFFYPNGIPPDRVERSPIFKSEQECRSWCLQKKIATTNPERQCECGKNCKINQIGLFTCEDTIDE